MMSVIRVVLQRGRRNCTIIFAIFCIVWRLEFGHTTGRVSLVCTVWAAEMELGKIRHIKPWNSISFPVLY